MAPKPSAASASKKILQAFWHPPAKALAAGAWLWWFWLFFIHDKNTKKTGRCRQLMVLWSVKNDEWITCNGLDLYPVRPIVRNQERFELDGAAAAWYFDGKKMQENFLLHPAAIALHPSSRLLSAPSAEAGVTSSMSQKGEDFITKITTPKKSFEFRARQTDRRAPVGPTYGHTPLGLGLEIEGTRIERMQLRGWESGPGAKRKPIFGTAYVQKILLAAPPPAWYWGLYHFADGSIATYMQVYAGRAQLADNAWPHRRLRTPKLSLKEDILVFHAPTGRVYEGHQLKVKPSKLMEKNCWRHELAASGPGFTLTAQADAYSHACWSFQKSVGILPVRSTFQYNEYPATMRELIITPTDGSKPLKLKNGWGNMENAWGFLV